MFVGNVRAITKNSIRFVYFSKYVVEPGLDVMVGHVLVTLSEFSSLSAITGP